MLLHKKINQIFLFLFISLLFFALPSQKALAVLPFVPTFAPATIAAIEEVAIIEGARQAADFVSYSATFTSEQALCLKEIGPVCSITPPSIFTPSLSLDSVASLIAKTLSSLLIQSTTKWVRSGFEGSPAFVQDIEQFYINEAYKAIDNYLLEFQNVDMCNFFPDINTTISLSGPRSNVAEARCTIDDIREDAREFEEDFKSGEWLTFKTSLEKNNNPFGLYLFTQAEVQNAQAKNKADQKTKLGWAKGFLSFEEKDADGKSTGKVLTPGAMVEGQLSATFGAGFKSLELADEMDELFAALVQQAIGYALDQGGFFN